MPLVIPSSAYSLLSAGGLVRELATQMGEYGECVPTGTGTRTTIIDEAMLENYPSSVAQVNSWIYGAEGVEAANVGVERRIKSWNHTSTTFTLYAPGFPAAVVPLDGAVYELHTRTRRARKLRAINFAAGQLRLLWQRPFVSRELTTVEGQWEYVLPSNLGISQIDRIEVERDPANNLGYPFEDARTWDYKTYKTVDETGATTWTLQFGTPPAPNRILRIFGWGFYPTLSSDGDVLALDGEWSEAALDWLFHYAQYLLAQWEGNLQPAGQNERYRIWSLDRLNAARRELMKSAPQGPPSVRLITPVNGTAQSWLHPGGLENFAIFGSQAH